MEVFDIYVAQEIPIIKNGETKQELKVPGYVIFENINTANSYVKASFATGKLDLTWYTDSLLVNSEFDIEETKKALSHLGIEV